MEIKMIELGSKVKDKITGFTGIAISHIKYLTGCDQIGVTPEVDKDGKVQDTHYFDYTRLDVIENPIKLNKSVDKKTGGPNRDAPKKYKIEI